MGKIPERASYSNNKLGYTNNEGTDPKQSEQMIDPNNSCCIVPFNVSNRVALRFLSLANTVDPKSTYDPPYLPDSNDKEENDRY
jgi:hypothetical protein